MGSSPPRTWTGVSCIAGGFFTNWAIAHWAIVSRSYSLDLVPQFWYRKGFNSACTPLQHHVVCGISVPKAGIEPRPLTMRARSPNHWTPKECSKSFWFWWSPTYLFLNVYLFVVWVSYLVNGCENFHLSFLQIVFLLFVLIFRPLIHFLGNFCVWIHTQNSSSACEYPVLSQYHLLESLLFPHCMGLTPLLKIIWWWVWVYF